MVSVIVRQGTTDDTDAADFHRLQCASIICVNRYYQCHLCAIFHVYICISVKFITFVS